jgi:REP element-mobilizing transposase RayT
MTTSNALPGSAGFQPAKTDPHKPKGWHSRGYLPHLDQPGLVQSITFRLHDAVPIQVLKLWKREHHLSEKTLPINQQPAQLRKLIDQYEDQGHGACLLQHPEVAEIMQNALLHFDGERYRLLAWCVMPNHVHAIIETRQDQPVTDVIHSWKSFVSNKINRLTGTKGSFWMPDYYDRFIRNDDHLSAAIGYVENNPVKAGLIREPAQWRFSSAGMRAGSPRSQG